MKTYSDPPSGGRTREVRHELGVIQPAALAARINRFEAFRRFSPGQIEDVARSIRPREFARRDPVFLACREADAVYLLLEGRVKITRTDPTTLRELILFIVRPGEFFGLPGPGTDRTARSNAVALQRSLVGCMSRESYQRLAREREFSEAVERLIGERLTRVTERLDELVFRDVPSRLARQLLRLASEFPRVLNGSTVIDVSLTQQDIADLIGSTRESANIAMNALKREGVIDMDRRSIVIRDHERLRGLTA